MDICLIDKWYKAFSATKQIRYKTDYSEFARFAVNLMAEMQRAPHC